MKNPIKILKWVALATALAAVIFMAACSSKSTTTTTTQAATSTPTTTTTSTTTAAGNTVMTANKAGVGDYLVDSKGMTLYYFAKDIIGQSNATAAILAIWPIFNPASFVVPSGLLASDFATITRGDGQKQATYKGWPLYYYSKDMAPGDVMGDGVAGIWFVLKVPFYTVMLQNNATVNTYLADDKGMTLYYFTKDSVGVSNASAAILANWPIFNPASFIVPSALQVSDFGTITRADGQKQATFRGYPLYHYAQDVTSGDTKGQGFGSVWYVVNPSNFPPAATTTTTTTPPASTTTTTQTTTTTTTTTTTPTATGAPVTLNLVAKGIAFDKSTLTVKAGAQVTLNFDNQDAGIPHNVSVYQTVPGGNPKPIFIGQIVTGPQTITYTFTAPPAGNTYFFQCDVHPTQMYGDFVVTP